MAIDYDDGCDELNRRYPGCARAHHLMLGLALSAPSVSTQIGPYGRYFHQGGEPREYELTLEALQTQIKLKEDAEVKLRGLLAEDEERVTDDSTKAQCAIVEGVWDSIDDEETPYHNEAALSTAARVTGAFEVPNDADAHGFVEEAEARPKMTLYELLRALQDTIAMRDETAHTKEFFLKRIGDVRRCARHWYVELLRLTDVHFNQINDETYCTKTYESIRDSTKSIRRALCETPLPDDWMSSEDMVEALDTMWRDVNLALRTFVLRQNKVTTLPKKPAVKSWLKSQVFSFAEEFHAKSLARLEKKNFVFTERPSSRDPSHACNDPRALIDILDVVCRKEGDDIFFKSKGSWKVYYPSDAVILEKLKRAQKAMVNISANERGPIAGWYTAANGRIMDRKEIFQRFMMSFWLRKCDEVRWRDTRMTIGKPYAVRVSYKSIFPVQSAKQRQGLIEEFDMYEKLARRKSFFPTDWSDKDSDAIRRVFKNDPVLILGVTKDLYQHYVRWCEGDARCEHLILRALAERILGALGSSHMAELGWLYSEASPLVITYKGRLQLWDFKFLDDLSARFELPSADLN